MDFNSHITNQFHISKTIQSDCLLFGWPEILCTDRGSNFCSQLTQEFLARMGVTPRVNSPYHPEASGIIERFSGSFKQMLHHAINDYGRQWLGRTVFRYAMYHNVTTKDKAFRVGDQVIVLEKDSTHKTLTDDQRQLDQIIVIIIMKCYLFYGTGFNGFSTIIIIY